jgi:hypothetical protein
MGKRRGAPNKGQVSDNKVEKFKPQRQKVFRTFKSYYEARIMPGVGVNAPKKRNKGQVDEQEQRNLSSIDAHSLFSTTFIHALPARLG